ncbi:MAG: hypothetical protein FWB97_09765 [Oscillospiraceae bacterium]|nr:hypothetical protein [Oscillospiraceae bacterium]
MTKATISHVHKLVLRIVLLAAAIFLHFADTEVLDFTNIFQQRASGLLLWGVWALFFIEMLFRLIPNKRITIGARKHYKCSYKAAPTSRPRGDSPSGRLHGGVAASGLGWFIITAAVIFALHQCGALTAAALFVIMLALAVVDLVFVLFFCPFQVLFMRNRCCADCRIFNWDYFMMCAPLALAPSFYSVSLVAMSLAVLIRWEVAVSMNPHYFMKENNVNLNCEECKDKLCRLRIGKNRKS